jgi:hypothetical protein
MARPSCRTRSREVRFARHSCSLSQIGRRPVTEMVSFSDMFVSPAGNPITGAWVAAARFKAVGPHRRARPETPGRPHDLVRRRLARGTSRPWLAGLSAEIRARRCGARISAVCCKTKSRSPARGPACGVLWRLGVKHPRLPTYSIQGSRDRPLDFY